mgnify:CR=1 FL=1
MSLEWVRWQDSVFDNELKDYIHDPEAKKSLRKMLKNKNPDDKPADLSHCLRSKVFIMIQLKKWLNENENL